jgi:hypothetical protein
MESKVMMNIPIHNLGINNMDIFTLSPPHDLFHIALGNQGVNDIVVRECQFFITSKIRAYYYKSHRKLVDHEILQWPLPVALLDSQYARNLLIQYPLKNVSISFAKLDEIDESQERMLRVMMKFGKFMLPELSRCTWFEEYKELDYLFDTMKKDQKFSDEVVQLIQKYMHYYTNATKGKTIQNTVMGVVQSNPGVVRHKDIALLAVREQPSILKKLEETWKDDEEIVMAAVTQEGTLLPHASDRCKQIPYIVETAWSNAESFEHIEILREMRKI